MEHDTSAEQDVLVLQRTDAGDLNSSCKDNSIFRKPGKNWYLGQVPGEPFAESESGVFDPRSNLKGVDRQIKNRVCCTKHRDGSIPHQQQVIKMQKRFDERRVGQVFEVHGGLDGIRTIQRGPRVETNNIALQGSLNEKEKSFDQVTLSPDSCESLAKRPSQQIREMQKTEVFPGIRGI